MPAYHILTREYTYTDYVYEGGGPTYTDRDWCIVNAVNKRQARGAGVKHLRRMKAGIFDDGECPFKGLEVWLVEDIPSSVDDVEGMTIEEQIQHAAHCGNFFDAIRDAEMQRIKALSDYHDALQGMD